MLRYWPRKVLHWYSILCTVWRKYLYARNITEVFFFLFKNDGKGTKKGNTHQKNSCLVTKHDTAEKYLDTTRTSVLTDHFSPIPSRHVLTLQCTYNYGLCTQYSDKPSQLSSSMFSTVPIILPGQQPTLSPSGLPTEILMITPITTPSRHPKNLRLTNLLGYHFFTKCNYQQETITDP